MSPGSERHTILVVEDESHLLRLAKSLLESRGFEVLAAEDGDEGLRLFGSHAPKIALVLLDLQMPRVSGQAVLQQILELDPNAAVVVTSGDVLDETALDFEGRRPRCILRKPYGPMTLLES